MVARDKNELQASIVLAVAAHPDDLEFTAAGTIAKFIEQGATVYYTILTDGCKGSADAKTLPKDISKRRQQEQQAAAHTLGVKKVFFLNYKDCTLENCLELRRDLVRLIRQLQPEVVIAMDPSMLYWAPLGFINHPDHRAGGQATLDAIYPLARDHLSFPELLDDGYQPHQVKTVLLTNFENPNCLVDIGQTMDKKAAALASHSSQKMHLPSMQKLMKDLAVESGKAHGCQYAESFVRIDILV